MDKNRLMHSHNVGLKCQEIGKFLKLDNTDELFYLGYVHDIGYQFGSAMGHAKNGGEFLKGMKYPYWKEVYYHGALDCSYDSLYLNILNLADNLVDYDGAFVSLEKRSENIRKRYANKADSVTLEKIMDAVEHTNKKNKKFIESIKCDLTAAEIIEFNKIIYPKNN